MSVTSSLVPLLYTYCLSRSHLCSNDIRCDRVLVSDNFDPGGSCRETSYVSRFSDQSDVPKCKEL